MERIVLLHGALGHAAELSPLARSFQKRGLHAELLNFSGHGHQAIEGDFSVDGFSEEVSRFLSDHQNESTHVFGYSMGGYIALKTAASRPFNGKIFTLGTRLSWTDEFALAEIKKLDPEKIEEKVPAFADRLQKAHGENWKDLVRKTAMLINDLGKNNYLTDTLLASIENQVYLGLGDKDTMADATDTMRVSKVIRQGQMYMLPATRHQIESVDPELFADLVCAVIRR